MSSSSTSPTPPDPGQPGTARTSGASLRIGHAERDAAVDQLAQAYADGSLDRAELEERSDRALRARTRGELQPLTADLAKPREPTRSGPGHAPEGGTRGGTRRRVATARLRSALRELCCCAPPRDPVNSPHWGVDLRR
ncbi:MAG: DUF1707 domain-containing protein [Streptomyces sp.]|nr:DUF1707 domain-containing protein [Streptomyces sp.]NUQ98623.1 DUF1707 domain-containing protein [Streptomyces sp.]